MPSNPPLTREQIQTHFDAFYEDFFCEAAKLGKVEELLVCENRSMHLTGNVYVRFRTERQAQKACDNFNTRWYGGRPIYCELSPLTNFSEALCRKYDLNMCNRAGFCNFIHKIHPSPALLKSLELSQQKYRLESNTGDSSTSSSSSVSSSTSSF